MNNSVEKIKKIAADVTMLPEDIVLKIPKITIVGMNEVTIENHNGIRKFQTEIVEINSKVWVISIKGNNFEILYISSHTIILSGIFKAIEYEARSYD